MKTRLVHSAWAGLRLLAFGLALTGAALAGPIDGFTEAVLDRVARGNAQLPPQAAPVRRGDLLNVHIEGRAQSVVPAVAALGGRVQSVIAGRYLTAEVPAGAVRALAARGDVARVQAARRVQLYNDLGNIAQLNGVDWGNASRATGTFGPADYSDANGTGAGVVVCAVDTGIDVTHPDFQHADGSTRILGYWDQSDVSDSNPPLDLGMSYGVEYDAAAIDAANAAGQVVGPDTDAHGSHVMGTIAGNGAAGALGDALYDTYYLPYQFAGVAPEADIVMVKFDFGGSRNSTASIVDGVRYCIERARALRGPNTPVAINLSLGTDFGPHDGTTLEERSLDALVTVDHPTGAVVFAAAGNAGEVAGPTAHQPHAHLPPANPIHGQGTLARRATSEITADLSFNALGRFPGENNDFVFFDIWYDGDANCDVEVTAPDGTTYSNRQWRTGRNGAGIGTPNGAIFVYNAPNQSGGDVLGWDSDNGDNEIYIEISDGSGYDIVEGQWTITLTGTGGNSAYHGWHGVSDNLLGAALTYEGVPTDNRLTVGSPATASHLVSVGAYSTRGDDAGGPGNENAWIGTDGQPHAYDQSSFPVVLGDLAFFSSRGPDRNGMLHPDITGPGVGIISVRSQQSPSDPGTAIAGDWYRIMQGTSMSTPNVTGAGALALAVDGSLNPLDLRNAMQNGARVDAFVLGSGFASDAVGSAPNNDWGAGKLDVPGTLAQLAPCVPEAEVCDGADNDCDGQIDEGVGNACGGCGALGGNPGDACGDCGSLACDGEEALVCDDPGLNACGACGSVPAEDCGNGVDDDCDGFTDGDDDDCAGPVCGGNKAPCNSGADCCSGNCKHGSCKGN